METINKALHHPMPFTTGGQTINDRLTAAKHSLSGSQLGKTICKATTEELMAPKKKHLDYLLHCTHEPNVSIPQMANLLIERTQNPNWTVVYKSLITIHNIMCYGNERFSQYLASCNTTFNLGNFLDKGGVQGEEQRMGGLSREWSDWSVPGYDMSQHVRRYGKYISEKIYTYRLCAFDFCKVKRGREDGLLRTMHTDKILKTIPILQNQIDALLEFQVSASELNNGVINCSFILLFRDLIRLFACYNDGVINLLEKYFDMNKKQCREALDMYKGFLVRLDKVAEFLKVAESVGIDRGEIPDLARAPASLLEALEAHVIQLEGGRPPPPSQPRTVSPSALHQLSSMTDRNTVDAMSLDDSVKNKYLEEEKERLRMYEEQRRRELNASGDSRGGHQNGTSSGAFNPFGGQSAAPAHPPPPSKPSDDLLNLFDTPVPAMPVASHQPMMDSTNPFATGMFAQQQQPVAPAAHPGFFGAPSSSTGGGQFGADFSRAFPTSGGGTQGLDPYNRDNMMRPASAAPMMTQQQQQQQQANKTSFAKGDLDSALSSLANNLSMDSKSGGTNKPVQWGGPRPAVAPATIQPMPGAQPGWGAPQPPGMGYGPPPGMYGQPMMNMYGQPMPPMMGMQPGMQPGMVRPAYGMQQPPQPNQDPFGQFG